MKIFPRIISWVSDNYFPQFKTEMIHLASIFEEYKKTRGVIMAVKM